MQNYWLLGHSEVKANSNVTAALNLNNFFIKLCIHTTYPYHAIKNPEETERPTFLP